MVFCKNQQSKSDIIQRINELRGIGVSRTNAFRQICEQRPKDLLLLNDNQELLKQISRQDKQKDKEGKKEQTQEINQQIQKRLADERARSILLIKRGLQNPKNQKFATKIVDKKIAETGHGLTEDDMKKIKAKIISKGK